MNITGVQYLSDCRTIFGRRICLSKIKINEKIIYTSHNEKSVSQSVSQSVIQSICQPVIYLCSLTFSQQVSFLCYLPATPPVCYSLTHLAIYAFIVLCLSNKNFFNTNSIFVPRLFQAIDTKREKMVLFFI